MNIDRQVITCCCWSLPLVWWLNEVWWISEIFIPLLACMLYSCLTTHDETCYSRFPVNILISPQTSLLNTLNTITDYFCISGYNSIFVLLPFNDNYILRLSWPFPSCSFNEQCSPTHIWPWNQGRCMDLYFLTRGVNLFKVVGASFWKLECLPVAHF